MSLYEALSLVVSICGFVGVITSLRLIQRQIQVFARQADYMARSIREGMVDRLGTQSQEISKYFVQYPELRPFFYEGRALRDEDPCRHRAEALAEVILDLVWSISNTARRMPSRDESESQVQVAMWEAYVGDFLSTSPVMCAVLDERQDWYGSEFYQTCQQSLQTARQRSRQPVVARP